MPALPFTPMMIRLCDCICCWLRDGTIRFSCFSVPKTHSFSLGSLFTPCLKLIIRAPVFKHHHDMTVIKHWTLRELIPPIITCPLLPPKKIVEPLYIVKPKFIFYFGADKMKGVCMHFSKSILQEQIQQPLPPVLHLCPHGIQWHHTYDKWVLIFLFVSSCRYERILRYHTECHYSPKRHNNNLYPTN